MSSTCFEHLMFINRKTICTEHILPPARLPTQTHKKHTIKLHVQMVFLMMNT
jgi:hypothetical protein